jgi:transposase
MVLFEKFGQHQPLNRQCERFAREGVGISLSTLADQVGACAGVLTPLHDLMAAHVLAADVKVHAIFLSMGRQNSSPPMIMFPSGVAPGSGRDQP